jgi:protein tyrosine/serine phosphatase
MKKWTLLLVLVACVPAWTAPASADSATLHAKRSASFATPIPLDGVPNLHRVAPNFYRSAQPTADGFRALKAKYGLRTVISLRDFHTDESLVTGLNLRLFRVGMHAWHIEQEDLAIALHDLVTSMQRGPTLLHCQHGADRTGVVTALYRVVYQGWDKEKAIEEMRSDGFGYHDMWINIPAFVRDVDIEKLKRDINALKK